MMVIDIKAIHASDVLNSISVYSDYAYKRALENAINKKIAEAVVEKLDVFDVVVKSYLDAALSFAEIKKIGGLPINSLEIIFKKKDKDESIDLCFSDEYKGGYIGYGTRQFVLTKQLLQAMKITAQKKAFKYIKRMRSVVIPSKNFIMEESNIVQCPCTVENLYPLQDSFNRWYIVWKCRCCGKEYVCSCFKEAITEMKKEFGSGSIKNRMDIDMNNASFRENICHLCRKVPSSNVFYAHGGKIGKYYYPYIMRELYGKHLELRDAENSVREQLGVPKIGEGWVSQTQLYYTLVALFPEYDIQREASPDWLGRQRYDIYFPQAKLAIEYQGKQHFEPVDIFGGEEGFKRTVERDKEKLLKSKKNGITVLFISYKDKLDEDSLYSRVKKHLK